MLIPCIFSGYLVEVLGNSRAKLQFPKEEKQELALVQHFLVLQILIPIGVPFGIEITVSDTNKVWLGHFWRYGLIEYRINGDCISPRASRRSIRTTFIPKFQSIAWKEAFGWIWVLTFWAFSSCSKAISTKTSHFSQPIHIGQTFRSIDSFVLSGGYKLRKIFTMKSPLLEYDPDGQDEPISNPEAYNNLLFKSNTQIS